MTLEGWAAVADLAGFVGGLALAVPFFFGQVPRDSVLLALARRKGASAFDQTIDNQIKHIARHWHWEARSAYIGALLLAAAFVIRFIVAIAK